MAAARKKIKAGQEALLDELEAMGENRSSQGDRLQGGDVMEGDGGGW